jgi:hypothetical protein
VQYATWPPATPLTALCAPRRGVPGRSQRTKRTSNDFGAGARDEVSFAEHLSDFMHEKLARNQTFTARCVPNMYLFCTFSSQNRAEIDPIVAAFTG